MKRKGFLVAIVLGIGFIFPARPAAAQKNRTDWTAVQVLRSGTAIKVRTRKLNIACTLSEADEDSLTCEHGTPITFSRAEIRSVTIPRRNPHRASSVLIGGAIFAGVGAVVGLFDTAANNYWETFQQRQSLGWGAAVGAGVFVGVGALIEFWPRSETVYKAP